MRRALVVVVLVLAGTTQCDRERAVECMERCPERIGIQQYDCRCACTQQHGMGDALDYCAGAKRIREDHGHGH